LPAPVTSRRRASALAAPAAMPDSSGETQFALDFALAPAEPAADAPPPHAPGEDVAREAASRCHPAADLTEADARPPVHGVVAQVGAAPAPSILADAAAPASTEVSRAPADSTAPRHAGEVATAGAGATDVKTGVAAAADAGAPAADAADVDTAGCVAAAGDAAVPAVDAPSADAPGAAAGGARGVGPDAPLGKDAALHDACTEPTTSDLLDAAAFACAPKKDSSATAISRATPNESELAVPRESFPRGASGPKPQEKRRTRAKPRWRKTPPPIYPWPGEAPAEASAEASTAAAVSAPAESPFCEWRAPEDRPTPSVAAAYDLETLRGIVQVLEELSLAYPTAVPSPVPVPPVRPRRGRKEQKRQRTRGKSNAKKPRREDGGPAP
jgi:hypothetical protein